MTQILMSVMMVSMMFQSVSRAMASAGRINEVIDADPVIEGGNVTEGKGKATIEFQNVSFRYPGTRSEERRVGKEV